MISSSENRIFLSAGERDDVKTSNLRLVSEETAGFEDLDAYFGNSFTEPFNRLVHSESLADVKNAFEIARKSIGHIEFVNAILDLFGTPLGSRTSLAFFRAKALQKCVFKRKLFGN